MSSATVHNQIMWNRLIAIVEEQALTLVRTSFSTSVREAGDLSAGVFDREGRLMAQAVTGTPGHVNTMAAAVGHFIDDIGPERIFDGDVYITNDPWKGTDHLHDITVTTPVFHGEELVGFFASTSQPHFGHCDTPTMRVPSLAVSRLRTYRSASSRRSPKRLTVHTLADGQTVAAWSAQDLSR